MTLHVQIKTNNKKEAQKEISFWASLFIQLTIASGSRFTTRTTFQVHHYSQEKTALFSRLHLLNPDLLLVLLDHVVHILPLEVKSSLR